MKRSFAKIVLIAAILVMVLGCASVFAAEKAEVAKVAGGTEGLKFDAEADMTADTLNYSTSTYRNPYYNLGTNGGSDFYVASIKVKAAGKLYVDAEAYSSNSGSVTIAVGSIESDNKLHYFTNRTGYVSPGNAVNGIGGYDVKKGNTYYVGIQASSAATAKVNSYVIPYSTRSLSAGKEMIASGVKGSDNAQSTTMYKIKPKKTGYITVTLKDYGMSSSSGYVTLLNSKKKAVSDKLWYYSESSTSYVVFGVKKGTTYYLKVTGSSGSYTSLYIYTVKWKLKSAPFKSNTKKSKAIKLKRKAKAKSMTRPASRKSMTQWYKLKASKRTVKFTVDAKKIKSGTAKITVYRGKRKLATYTIWNGQSNPYTITNARKTTYHIKIATNSKCSGMYKIRYKS